MTAPATLGDLAKMLEGFPAFYREIDGLLGKIDRKKGAKKSKKADLAQLTAEVTKLQNEFGLLSESVTRYVERNKKFQEALLPLLQVLAGRDLAMAISNVRRLDAVTADQQKRIEKLEQDARKSKK